MTTEKYETSLDATPEMKSALGVVNEWDDIEARRAVLAYNKLRHGTADIVRLGGIVYEYARLRSRVVRGISAQDLLHADGIAEGIAAVLDMDRFDVKCALLVAFVGSVRMTQAKPDAGLDALYESGVTE